MGTAEKVRATFPMDGFIAFKYIICVPDLQGRNGQSITNLLVTKLVRDCFWRISRLLCAALPCV